MANVAYINEMDLFLTERYIKNDLESLVNELDYASTLNENGHDYKDALNTGCKDLRSVVISPELTRILKKTLIDTSGILQAFIDSIRNVDDELVIYDESMKMIVQLLKVKQLDEEMRWKRLQDVIEMTNWNKGGDEDDG